MDTYSINLQIGRAVWVLVGAATLSCCAAVSENIKEAVFEATPGEEWRLDWTWHEKDVPLTTFLQPHVTAYDVNGKQIYANDVGRAQQRVFGPEDFSIQKWRVYVRIAEDDEKPVTGFFTALAKVTLPSATRRVKMTLTHRGDDADYDRVTMGVTKLSAPPPATPYGMTPGFPQMEEREEDILSDAELDAVLARREKCFPKLVSSGDRTELHVNGKPIVPRIFKSAARACRNRHPSVSVYSQKGFNIMTMGFSLPPSVRPGAESSSGIWRADGSCDSEKVRKEIREYLRRFPDGMFMLAFGVAPHLGWGEANPSEIVRNEKGRFGIFCRVRLTAYRDTVDYDYKKEEWPAFSYTSEKFADDASVFLEKLFSDIESWPEGKAVIGAYVCGGTDGQWLDVFDNHVAERQAADYSDCARRRFAEFRAQKYGKDVDARIPSADEFWCREKPFYAEHGSTLFSDYREFLARATTEMRLKLATAIKRGTNGRMLVGAYSPNSGLAGYPLISQTYAKGLIDSPDYDFFAVVPNYMREHVDPVVAAVFDGSLIRHGKLYIAELDLRSADVGNWGFWGSEFWRSTHNTSTFRRQALAFAANAVTHGGGFHAYDMDGGWYATEAAQETWSVVNAMAEKARAMPFAPERIAMVGGERYWDFQSMGKGRIVPYFLRELPREALAKCGAPWNCYMVEELLDDKDAELPKVVLFTDLTTVSCAQFQELKRRYAKDGRVLVWFWRPGLFAADGLQIEEALGLKPAPDAFRKLGFADGSSKDPLMRGVKGTLMATYPYYGYDFAQVSRPDPEAGWLPLAHFKNTQIPALAVRRNEDYTEVYTAMPGGITPQLCRNLLREAKLAPLLETNEISGYGSGLFYILAQSNGKKRFRLPVGRSPEAVLAGPAFREDGAGYFVVNLKRGDIFILKVK
jgi:hypothetical protein